VKTCEGDTTPLAHSLLRTTLCQEVDMRLKQDSDTSWLWQHLTTGIIITT
jgi:hypothetical protein